MNTNEKKSVPNLAPYNCGDIDISILANGTWTHDGSPITRMSLVKLFAGVLERDEAGDFWLVTPVEKARIFVEDVPFIAVKMEVEGSNKNQIIHFTTNLDDKVSVGIEHPLVFRSRPNGDQAPYIMIRKGLEASTARQVWYELADLFQYKDSQNSASLGVWSNGLFFSYDSNKDL